MVEYFRFHYTFKLANLSSARQYDFLQQFIHTLSTLFHPFFFPSSSNSSGLCSVFHDRYISYPIFLSSGFRSLWWCSILIPYFCSSLFFIFLCLDTFFLYVAIKYLYPDQTVSNFSLLHLYLFNLTLAGKGFFKSNFKCAFISSNKKALFLVLQWWWISWLFLNYVNTAIEVFKSNFLSLYF